MNLLISQQNESLKKQLQSCSFRAFCISALQYFQVGYSIRMSSSSTYQKIIIEKDNIVEAFPITPYVLQITFIQKNGIYDESRTKTILAKMTKILGNIIDFIFLF